MDKKKLLCRLGIHSPVNRGESFYDPIGQNVVYKYKCKACRYRWLATSKYSWTKADIKN